MNAPNEPIRDIAAERRVLGAALRDVDSMETVLRELRADDFWESAHRAVFATLSERSGEGRSVDPLLVADDLIGSPELQGTSAEEIISTLILDAATPSALPEWTTKVRSASDARRLVETARAMAVGAMASGGDPSAIKASLADASNTLSETIDRIVTAPWEGIGPLVKDLDNSEALQPLFATGFPQLDRVLEGGAKPGQLWIVAGRPAQGKSTLSMDIVRSACVNQGVPGLVISLEMSSQELAARFLAAESGIPLSNIQSRKLEEDDLGVIESVGARIENAPLYIVDDVEASTPAIATLIQSAHRRLKAQVVVVDYSGLITSDGKKDSSRENIVGGVSRTLKALARQLKICIIMVAQLNRGPEQRADKKPMLSDLRESGQAEQDGDVVLLVFRPEEYDPMTDRQGEADIIVAKHRNGSKGTVTLGFQGPYARFVSISNQEEPPEDDSYPSAPPDPSAMNWGADPASTAA